MMQTQALERFHAEYQAQISRYCDAVAKVSFPTHVHHDSPISPDNYVSWLVSKHYLEDLHSTTLAYLLSFTAPGDGRSRPFLEGFVLLLEELAPEGIRLQSSLVRFEVRQEHRSDGWIDLLLVDRQAKVAVIIENKIRAGDQARQLPKYYADMSKEYAIPTTVYLTLDGHEPNRDDWTSEDWSTPVLCVAYAADEKPSILSHVLEPALADSRCQSLAPLITWYMEIVRDLQGRHRVIGMLRDFSRELIGKPDAMTAIADVLNNQAEIEAAVCKELGERFSAALKTRSLEWTVRESTYDEGRDIGIKCSDRVDYHVWFENNIVSHGFVSDGKEFGPREKRQFDAVLGDGAGPIFENTVYFTEVMRISLADRELPRRLSEDGVNELVDRAQSTIREYMILSSDGAAGRK